MAKSKAKPKDPTRRKAPAADPEIAGRLRELIKEKRITQREFATEIGVTTQAITTWLSSDASPHVGHVRKISDRYGISADWLIRGQGEPGFMPVPDVVEKVIAQERVPAPMAAELRAMNWPARTTQEMVRQLYFAMQLRDRDVPPRVTTTH